MLYLVYVEKSLRATSYESQTRISRIDTKKTNLNAPWTKGAEGKESAPRTKDAEVREEWKQTKKRYILGKQETQEKRQKTIHRGEREGREELKTEKYRNDTS